MTPTELSDARKSLRWSRAKLAEQLGVSTGAVVHWERGTRKIPQPVAKLVVLWERQVRKALTEIQP